MAVAALRAADVDTRWIVRGGSRCGIYFLEHGSAQRPSKVVYDRAGSGMTDLAPGMLPWADALADASWFHTTGITPALSASAAEATIGSPTDPTVADSHHIPDPTLDQPGGNRDAAPFRHSKAAPWANARKWHRSLCRHGDTRPNSCRWSGLPPRSLPHDPLSWRRGAQIR